MTQAIALHAYLTMRKKATKERTVLKIYENGGIKLAHEKAVIDPAFIANLHKWLLILLAYTI